MELSLGPVIKQQRKEKKLTQQELADFMNVTKASVSKWENGQSYPDITSLPLLATYFDMTIDDLLNYQPQLSAAEIQHLYATLQQSLPKQDAAERFATVARLVKHYYSCYPFVYQMAVFVLNHFDTFAGESTAEKTARYIPEALTYLDHVQKNSAEADLLNETKKMQAYCYLILKEPDKVLALTGNFIANHIPSDDLIAAAYQLKGDLPSAVQTSQSGIFQNVIILLSSLTNYMQLTLNDAEKFQATFARGQQVVVSFALETTNPAATLNFYTSALAGFAALQLEASVTAVLEKLTPLLTTERDLKISGDAYFDAIEPWLAHSVRGGETPRTAAEIKKSLRDFILHFPALEPYKNNPTLVALRAQLTEKEPHHE